MKAVLDHSESGAVSSAMSEDGVGSGLVVALEDIKPIGRTRPIKRDAVKNPVCNTPKATSDSAGRVERVKYEIEKIRTWRSWFEEESEDLKYNVLPHAVRHCAWQMTHRHVRSDGKKQIERLRGRPSRGQVPEFAEVDHFRDTQRIEPRNLRTLRSWMWRKSCCRKPELRDRRSSTSGGWTMRREERWKILMQSGAEWMRHRSTRTTVKMWCRQHYQSKRPVSF